MNNKQFSQNLRRLRDQKNWSMQKLADEANVSLQTIFRAESKNIVPRGNNIVKIAQALGATESELFEDSTVPKSVPEKRVGDMSPDEFLKLISDSKSVNQNKNSPVEQLVTLIRSLSDSKARILLPIIERLIETHELKRRRGI